MRNDLKLTINEQKVTRNEQKVTSNEQKVTSNEQIVTSNKQKVTSNEQRAKSSASFCKNEDNNIILIIKNLNVGKAYGWNNSSVRMIKFVINRYLLH